MNGPVPTGGRYALVILAGAVVCTLCDHLHVAFGVLSYAHPDVWGQAWWVPLLFAVSTCSVIVGVLPVRALVGGEPVPRPADPAAIVSGSALFVLAYAFTAFADAAPNLILGTLALVWLFRVSRGVLRWLVVYSLVVGLIGPSVEATLSGLGLFVYRAPDILGVPRWLPALYLHAGLVAGPVSRWLRRVSP